MKLVNGKGRSSIFLYYSMCFSLTAAGLLGLIVLFNLWIDFSGVFGFSDRIDLRADNRRLLIPGVIRQFQPNCVIVGTSRVGRGIDPRHPSLRKYKCLNLYLNAGDAYEVAKVIEFAVETVNLRLVLIGLDFFMFDEDLDVPSYSKRFHEETWMGPKHLRKGIKVNQPSLYGHFLYNPYKKNLFKNWYPYKTVLPFFVDPDFLANT